MEDNDSELLHIYDNIVLKNLSCCGICFRVDNQSGLVPPKAIKDLIEVLNLPGEFITQIRVVCYVCEAHANRALRFHSVVSMADRLHGLFHKMLIRKSFEKQVRECLKTCRGPKIFNSEVHKNALDCEEQMKKVRSRCRLQQTEILNIDTELVDSSGEDNSLVMSMQNITPQCNPIMETLVILDDEDEPKVNEGKIVSTTEVKCDKPPMNTPKLVPIEKLLQPPRPTQNFMPMFTNPMPLLQPENPSYMLHPIVMGRDGSFNVPSLSATLVGGLVYQNNTNPLLLMNASDPSIFAGNQNNSAVLVGNKEQSTGLVGNKEKSTISVGNKDQSAILVGNKVESAILVRNKELSTILVENKDNSSVLVGKEDITNTTKKKKKSNDFK